jgi:four helix bundle protein
MFEARSSKQVGSKPPLRSHEDLDAYRLAMELLVKVHALCKRLPAEEKYELVSQMRRASKSIPANIAEGFGRRGSAKEFKQFMRTAMGSANEMETHLRIAGRLGYVAGDQLDALADGYNHVGRQLNRLIAGWQRFGQLRTSSLEPRGTKQ